MKMSVVQNLVLVGENAENKFWAKRKIYLFILYKSNSKQNFSL